MVIQLPRFKGKVAIVTGASAGIGAALCEQLVEAGVKVVGFARRSEKVEELSKKLAGKAGKLWAVKCDVGVEEQVVKAFKWTKDHVGPVSVLVNNAGVVRPTYLIDGDAAEWKRCLDTNVMGLSVCTREAIKQMRDNGIDGHIIHVNSVTGHMVVPMAGLNMYPASKFAVTALTETLRYELNAIESKIKITSLSPGAVKTEIMEANNLTAHFPAAASQLDVNTMPFLASEDVADAAMYILSTPPHVLINELTIRPVGEKI